MYVLPTVLCHFTYYNLHTFINLFAIGVISVGSKRAAESDKPGTCVYMHDVILKMFQTLMFNVHYLAPLLDSSILFLADYMISLIILDMTSHNIEKKMDYAQE